MIKLQEYYKFITIILKNTIYDIFYHKLCFFLIFYGIEIASLFRFLWQFERSSFSVFMNLAALPVLRRRRRLWNNRPHRFHPHTPG